MKQIIFQIQAFKYFKIIHYKSKIFYKIVIDGMQLIFGSRIVIEKIKKI